MRLDKVSKWACIMLMDLLTCTTILPWFFNLCPSKSSFCTAILHFCHRPAEIIFYFPLTTLDWLFVHNPLPLEDSCTLFAWFFNFWHWKSNFCTSILHFCTPRKKVACTSPNPLPVQCTSLLSTRLMCVFNWTQGKRSNRWTLPYINHLYQLVLITISVEKYFVEK